MPRQPKPVHTYNVFVTSYVSAEVKERVERGEEYITGPEQLSTEMPYRGTSESKAGTAFYRAVKQAMKNPLALHVMVSRDGKEVIAYVKIERRSS